MEKPNSVEKVETWRNVAPAVAGLVLAVGTVVAGIELNRNMEDGVTDTPAQTGADRCDCDLDSMRALDETIARMRAECGDLRNLDDVPNVERAAVAKLIMQCWESHSGRATR